MVFSCKDFPHSDMPGGTRITVLQGSWFNRPGAHLKGGREIVQVRFTVTGRNAT
jgi:hypothetical protein